MKLKYQMRGLGIGIIVTALLMGVVKGDKVPLSDAEIKVRALELGMVESNSMKLSDIPNVTPQQGESSASYGVDAVPIGESGAADSGSQAASGAEEGPEGSGAPESEDGAPADSGTEPEDGAVADSAVPEGGAPHEGTEGETSGDGHPETGTGASDSVTFVIESGVTSYGICQSLVELGLVEDAARFDDYLCDMGYSRKIQSGTYQIPRGATEEEISKIITRQ